MKPYGKFSIAPPKEPVLVISHYDLEKIRHVVRIAPSEAQWFHQVARIETEKNILYKLHNMIIPEQECSGAQVETDPMQMVKMYNAIKESATASLGIEDAESATDEQLTELTEKVNEVTRTLTSWSHSHVNMGVGPSGQDRRQFRQHIEQAADQGIDAPQLMLIFNKKDDYYSELYDPQLNLNMQNLDMIVTSYDFSDITAECKLKMKEAKKYLAKLPKKGDWSRGLFGKAATPSTGKSSPKGSTSSTKVQAKNFENLWSKTAYPWEEIVEDEWNSAQLIDKLEAMEDFVKDLAISQVLQPHEVIWLSWLFSENTSRKSALRLSEENFKKAYRDEKPDDSEEFDKAVDDLSKTLYSGLCEWEQVRYGLFLALALGSLKGQVLSKVVKDWYAYLNEEIGYFAEVNNYNAYQYGGWLDESAADAAFRVGGRSL